MMKNMDLLFICGFFIQALYLGVLDKLTYLVILALVGLIIQKKV